MTASELSLSRFFAADRVEFHFEEMKIPIPIDELSNWNSNLNDSQPSIKKTNEKESDLVFWLNLLGFKTRDALSAFIEAPLVKNKSLARQILRSWVGRKLLDEISDLVVIDQDKTGTKIFNTFERILEDQEQVSLIELLRAFPGEVIHFDLDGWVSVLQNWRNEIQRQTALLNELRAFSSKSKPNESGNTSSQLLMESINNKVRVKTFHRPNDLEVEVWKPVDRNSTKKNWIVFMPGLGGNPDHFRWLARSLSHKGWEVVLLDHPGSNSKAMYSLVEGSNPFPSGMEVFPYRLSDLKAVLEAKENGSLKVEGESVVLMGHSLGALIAFLAAGATPQKGLLDRCNKALDDLAFTNLSRLLQCQIVDVPLPEDKQIPDLSAIVGINSFGKLLWPDSLSAKTNVPILLAGGTYDLITPALSEQLGLLLSSSSNKLSKALIIEGASHFSPIRVGDAAIKSKENDVYQISQKLIGIHPISVQNLLSLEIIRFLENIEKINNIPSNKNNIHIGLKYYILNRSDIKKIGID